MLFIILILFIVDLFSEYTTIIINNSQDGALSPSEYNIMDAVILSF
mgnify:CR=1 FL=1